jgi:hypothetical protein
VLLDDLAPLVFVAERRQDRLKLHAGKHRVWIHPEADWPLED